MILERINTALEANQPARSLTLKPNELALVKALDLLTLKPMIYAANVAESDLADQGASNRHVVAMHQRAEEEGASLVIVSAQVQGGVCMLHGMGAPGEHSRRVLGKQVSAYAAVASGCGHASMCIEKCELAAGHRDAQAAAAPRRPCVAVCSTACIQGIWQGPELPPACMPEHSAGLSRWRQSCSSWRPQKLPST